MKDQDEIAEIIKATEMESNNGTGINSIIKLMELSAPATISEIEQSKKDPMLQVVLHEIGELRRHFDSKKKQHNGNVLPILLIKNTTTS